MNPTYDDLIAFHGHSCPGLAIGYRMANAAIAFLAQERAQDEELVAIVENDACGVDALQCITGCTFGKGNLIFKDYGKQVYTLYCRQSRTGVRVVFSAANVPQNIRDNRNQFINWLLTAPQEEVVALKKVPIDEPEPARITDSVNCQICQEIVMETRTKKLKGKPVCIPCAEQYGAS